jgi:hypothetical protein
VPASATLAALGAVSVRQTLAACAAASAASLRVRASVSASFPKVEIQRSTAPLWRTNLPNGRCETEGYKSKTAPRGGRFD